LLGSDLPFGTPTAAAIVAIRCGLEAGLTAQQIQAVAGGQIERLLDGQDPAALGPAPGGSTHRLPLVDRVFALLVAALSRMLQGVAADDLVRLARLGCEVIAEDESAAVLQSVAELLDRQQRYAAETSLDGRRAAGFHLALVAAAVAAAPSAPLPSLT
jgi:hypothetical protein